MKIKVDNATYEIKNTTIKNLGDGTSEAFGIVDGKPVSLRFNGTVTANDSMYEAKAWLGDVRRQLIKESGIKKSASDTTKEKLPKGVVHRSKNGSYSFQFWAWNGTKYTSNEQSGFKTPEEASAARAAFVEKCRKENGEIVNREFMKRLRSGSRKVTTKGSVVMIGKEEINLIGMPQTVACKLLAEKFREYDRKEADRKVVDEFFAEFIA